MANNAHFQHSTVAKPNILATGLVAYEAADYGGGFLNYTPPTPKSDFDIRVVEDTNATTPGKRLYIYAGGKWNYIEMDG